MRPSPAMSSASPTTARLRIGDTLTEGEDIQFTGVPYFAPEILRRVRLDDAMKAKKLRQALVELAEEGVVQLFRPQDGSAPAGRRRRHVAAGCAAGAPGRRIWRCDRIRRPRPFRSRGGCRRRIRRPWQVHRRQSQRHGRRCRWRPGVPRHLGLHDAPRGRACAGPDVPRHQGYPRGQVGSLNRHRGCHGASSASHDNPG